MRRARIAVSGLILASVANIAAAQLYRWTDEKGRVHITDTPPPASARSVEKKTVPGRGSRADGPTNYELAQAVRNFPVSLYTSPNCEEPCTNARAALNRRGVPFTEIQVLDEASREQLKRLSGRDTVPTLLVGRSVQSGFEQSLFDELLDAARYPKAGTVPARSQAAPPLPEGYVRPGQEPGAGEPPAPESPAPTGPYAPKPPR